MQPVPRTTSQEGSFRNIRATKAIKPSPKSCGSCIALVQTGAIATPAQESHRIHQDPASPGV